MPFHQGIVRRSNSRVQDNPGIRELLTTVDSFEHFKRLFPYARPLLKLLGVRVDQVEAAFAAFEALARNARELAALPDRFNAVFGQRGWVMYEGMNADVARAAVEKAEVGDVDGAEQDLVAYYDEATVRRYITMMNGVRAFRARIPLAEKALVDYAEGRFHACVPVTLALLDGMVNELGARVSSPKVSTLRLGTP